MYMKYSVFLFVVSLLEGNYRENKKYVFAIFFLVIILNTNYILVRKQLCAYACVCMHNSVSVLGRKVRNALHLLFIQAQST